MTTDGATELSRSRSWSRPSTPSRRPAPPGSAWGARTRTPVHTTSRRRPSSRRSASVPARPCHWFGLGRARLDTGDLQGALAAARRAVELAPDGAGRAAAPGPGLRAARRHPPGHPAPGGRRCGSTRSGRCPSATWAGRRWPWATTRRPGRRSRRRCASTPTSRPCGRPSADACSSRGARPNAVHVLETAVFARPADALAWARLGRAYFETGRHAEAARAFTRGFEHGQDEPWAWFWAGQNAAALGDGEALDRARRELKERDAEVLLELEKRIEAIVSKEPSATPEEGPCHSPSAPTAA